MSGISQPSLNQSHQNITAVVRIRPMSAKENASSQGNIIQTVDDKILIFDAPGEGNQKKSITSPYQSRAKNIHFGFDKVFAPDASQEQVFDFIQQSIFQPSGGLLDGYNCTVFAYGATGSGKTFTMAGSEEKPGLVPRCLNFIFNSFAQMSISHPKVKFSYFEIYNEQLRDLLSFADDPPKELKIAEDPQKGVTISNLSYSYPTDANEVLRLVQLGNTRRMQAETENNPVSSRSHAICQIEIEACDEVIGVKNSMKFGKLSLIDLAGSEKATSNTGIRLRESGKINCSLLELSNCINALFKQSSYIPYRRSKLTRILKDSLGGNCKTVCLSCVSPAISSYEDTYNTLQYANKAKNIKTNIRRNTINVKAKYSEYTRIIEELRAQLLQRDSSTWNDTALEGFRRSLEPSFIAQKRMIDSAINSCEPIQIGDVEKKISSLEKFRSDDIKSKMERYIGLFSSDCEKQRGFIHCSGSSEPFSMEERNRVLELENYALRKEIELFDLRMLVQESIINEISQHKGGTDENSGKVGNELPMMKPKSLIAANIKHMRVSDACLKDFGGRKILAESPNKGLSSSIPKPPIRSLMEQLSNRVASISTNGPTSSRRSSIIQSASLIPSEE